MPTPTYDLIASNVLGSATSSVEFTSIPATYRDLVLVVDGSQTQASGGYPYLSVNSDTSTIYPYVNAGQENNTAFSEARAEQTRLRFAYNYLYSDTTPSLYQINIMDYSATNKHKTFLIRWSRATQGNFAPGVAMAAGRWPSTSAITSVRFEANQWTTGSTFYLYGIAA